MLKRQIFKKTFSLIVFLGCLAILNTVNAQETITEDVISENEIIQQDNTLDETMPPEIDSSENDETSQMLSPLSSYTWADFLTNKDCRPFIQELSTKPEHNMLYQNLRSSCLVGKTSAWENLLNTFRKEKRKLLFNRIVNTDSSYTKYLEALPHLLFDIQNTKPTGNAPIDVLDKIEQVIIDRQIENVLPLFDELPDAWKNELKNTQVLTQKLSELKEQLENLNKIEQEVQND